MDKRICRLGASRCRADMKPGASKRRGRVARRCHRAQSMRKCQGRPLLADLSAIAASDQRLAAPGSQCAPTRKVGFNCSGARICGSRSARFLSGGGVAALVHHRVNANESRCMLLAYRYEFTICLPVIVEAASGYEAVKNCRSMSISSCRLSRGASSHAPPVSRCCISFNNNHIVC